MIVELELATKPLEAHSGVASPFLDMGQCTFGKLTVQLTRHNVHCCLEVAVDCVKVRWAVVTVIHSDDDTKKSTEFRHLANYSAGA